MINIRLEIEGFDREEIDRYREILYALIKSGGLTGVKAGKTIIHFDPEGIFQGIQLDYWPYKVRGRNAMLLDKK